jgi:hypothetical protein
MPISPKIDLVVIGATASSAMHDNIKQKKKPIVIYWHHLETGLHTALPLHGARQVSLLAETQFSGGVAGRIQPPSRKVRGKRACTQSFLFAILLNGSFIFCQHKLHLRYINIQKQGWYSTGLYAYYLCLPTFVAMDSCIMIE